ncbi:MAG: hypothetical protein R3D63_17365 [Paracoccaceae bacterium]
MHHPALPRQPRQPLLRLPSAPPYHACYLPGASDSLVIAFASIGHDPARPPSPEFIGSATAGGRAGLFISDASRSWGDAGDFAAMLDQALAAVRERQPVTRILTLGQSMGGFLALVAASLAPASLAPVEAVLALSPQYAVAPWAGETRWPEWTARLEHFRYPTAPLPPGARITLMHGLADDSAQALRFALQPGTDHVLFPGLTHSGLAPHLRARGVLPGLIDAALAGDRRRLLRIAASAGGRLRQRLADQLPR